MTDDCNYDLRAEALRPVAQRNKAIWPESEPLARGPGETARPVSVAIKKAAAAAPSALRSTINDF